MIAVLALAVAAYTNPVTAVSLFSGAVFVGRSDGAVERLGADLALQRVCSKPTGVAVSFITASPYGVAWLNGPGGAIREKAAAAKPQPQTLTIQTADQSYAVKILPESPIRRLAWLEGRVAVSYDFGTTFYDSKGHTVIPSTFMPADAAALASNGSLWVREQEDGTELALFARPHAVRRDPRNQLAPLVSLFTAFQVGAWQWARLGGFASNAFDAFPDGELQATEDGRIAGNTKFLVLSDRVGLARDGVVAREPEALVNVPIYTPDWEISRLDAASIPGDALWFGAGGDNAWWWNGTALIQQDRRSGQFSAYLPWGDPSLAPTSFAADAKGIWIGSNRGLRHIDPWAPDEKLGFAGFVRVPYGIEASIGNDEIAKKLTDAVFAWRFVDAEKAGADGSLMVASIYSALGIQLPVTLRDLKKAGTPVVSDVRFGDVIMGGTSAAIYLGNGITVEVRGNRVQNGDIWAFPKATVRRFLP